MPARRVAVEAELGELPNGATGRVDGPGAPTDPELAGRFVKETGVDLLAVSAGNVHIPRRTASRDLDLTRPGRSSAGGVERPSWSSTGGPASTSLVAEGVAISLGVAKVNYGT